MKLFVYGTLKEGFRLHSQYLSNSEFIGSHSTKPSFSMVNLGSFPGVIEKGDTPIQGEVWEVPRDDAFFIDVLEGYPSFYDKVQIDTDFGSASMYVLHDGYLDKYPQIESGNWIGETS